jgi:hypothetical protein
MKNCVIYVLLTAVVFAAVGYVACLFLNDSKSTLTSGSQETANPKGQDAFQAGWNAAQERLKDLGYINPDEQEVLSVEGAVEEVRGNTLKVSIQPVSPLDDPSLDTREIKVTNDTEIFLLKEKSEDQIAQAEKEFENRLNEVESQMNEVDASENPERYEELQNQMEEIWDQEPEYFTRENFSIDQIKERDQISVTASEDISDKKKFTAEVVEIMAQPQAEESEVETEETEEDQSLEEGMEEDESTEKNAGAEVELE